MTEHLSTPWHVDPLTASVYASDVPKGPARVADMRGWGYLTGHGHGALALSQDEAINIQRANAAFIVRAVNNHAALLKALTDLSNMYSHAWDRVDGGLTMCGSSVERFEKAHYAAQVALCGVTGDPLPISDEDFGDPVSGSTDGGGK